MNQVNTISDMVAITAALPAPATISKPGNRHDLRVACQIYSHTINQPIPSQKQITTERFNTLVSKVYKKNVTAAGQTKLQHSIRFALNSQLQEVISISAKVNERVTLRLYKLSIRVQAENRNFLLALFRMGLTQG